MSAFCKPQRLLKKSQFDWVFAEASKFSSKQFTILVRPNGLKRARLGLAIAKKADPRAVGRNRVKRLLRECFRAFWLQLPALDLVVLARPGIRGTDSPTLHAELFTLFEKLSSRHSRP